MQLTLQQAQRFLLARHGLSGSRRFIGKKGVMEFIRRVGCIQFDPVDVCGKNPELVLQSRIGGFSKSMLWDLLYKDRALVDYFDKQLAIFPVEDWPYFARFRRQFTQVRSQAEIETIRPQVLQAIRERGPLSSADLEMQQKVDWYWSSTKLSRAALEALYYRGELCVHHKKGAIKYYDLAENCISGEILSTPDPLPTDNDHRLWRVLRRIGAVGLLWNRPSDAFLGIDNLNAAERNRIFDELEKTGRIVPVQIEGISHSFYCRTEEAEALQQFHRKPMPRCEFLAPLDNLLWDRKLIGALWNFDYKWEIYTPASQRKYGHYVLPLLYRDQFAGRAELLCDKKAGILTLQNLWWESGFKPDSTFPKAFYEALQRFTAFNECTALHIAASTAPSI